MANSSNPFKKNAPREKKPPMGAQEPKKVEEVVSAPVEPVVPETPVEKPTDALEDVLNSIKDKKKPSKRSSTLYLSEKNLDWLKQKGDEVGLSSSEYLDQILTMLRTRA